MPRLQSGLTPLPPQQKDITMKQRALATIGVATMIALAIPGIAHGHNAVPNPSCSGLAWAAWNYDKTVVNSIVVKVDGATVHQDLDFKSSDEGSTPWTQTVSHTWSVVINAPGTQYDRNFAGTWQPCQTTTTSMPSSTTSMPSSTTVVAATTVPPTTPVPDVTTTVVTDTTVVAVDIPPVPTTVALGVATPDPTLTPDEPVLPRTGGASGFAIAIGLLLLGGVFAFTARRRIG